MSLSRILNDDLPPMNTPPAPSQPAYSAGSGPDPALMDRPLDTVRSPSPPRRRSHNKRGSEGQALPQAHTFQPVAYQASGAWDPHSGEWVQGEVSPVGPNVSFFSERGQSPLSPKEYHPAPSNITFVNEEGPDLAQSPPKKRRKGADDDGDYRPPGTRRSSRRYPPRNKQILTQSPPVDMVDHSPAETRYEPTEEERRLASSDLSDCEEVWIGELGNYILDTQKRKRLVEDYFERTAMDRNVMLMRGLSHRYVETIDRIPLPPPPPPRHQMHTSVEEELLSTLHAASPEHLDIQASGVDPYSPEHRIRPINGAEDAARELEESLLGPSKASKGKGKGKAREKRVASRPQSDASGSDLEVPIAKKAAHPNKRRKIAKEPSDITADFERSIADDQHSVASTQEPTQKPTPTNRKGKGKQIQREHSMDSISVTPKAPRKRTRRKLDTLPPHTQEYLGVGSAAPSVAGDITPAGSRPASPALTSTSAMVFEIDEAPPPLKRAKRVDESTMLKRVKALEEAQRKVWKNIARREVAKVYRYHATGYQQRQAQLKRIATLSSIQARRPLTRTPKATKDVQAKSKRLMREMLVFWKKNEKEERDVRKREQKEAIDRAKVEEEKREAARQARKLEFLISQTELYSHFVGNKLKTAEVEGEMADLTAVPAGATVEDGHPGDLRDIDFDDEDHTNLHRHARRNAEEAVLMARERAQAFDTQAALERKTNEAMRLAKHQAHIRDDGEDVGGASSTPLVDLDSDELNFQNPTSLSGPLTIQQPKMLTTQLKEYQLKGLNWLATLYEQGINGILADEMGLGKTVQSISLLAYLAETHDIWGPFLVVAPASTLHNWQQELTRFAPKLKAIPYWGNVKDRATLRKFWSKKEISYNQDAPFHVLITSYQLVTQDQQYFQRVKWQYMILDEAQNIKNAASVRWKTLLGFHCRNRLLLTGTPIQNSMQELWALLHFIMPSLFDSHDEFNEWFSKDIENAAENKGSKLNEHQLRRLHMILKPFMLRRVKRNVQNELSEKIEIDIYVDLSARQRALYKALLANVSVADLLEKAANIGDADSARSLMNLVMQFRKVCNHPELFERRDVVAPFSFAEFGRSGLLSREGDYLLVPYSTRNPIEYEVPELLYEDGGLVDVPPEDRDSNVLNKLMNIWATDWIQRSVDEDAQSAFAFLPLLNMSPGEAHKIHESPLIRRSLLSRKEQTSRAEEDWYYKYYFSISFMRPSIHLCSLHSDFSPEMASVTQRYRMPAVDFSLPRHLSNDLPGLGDIMTNSWFGSCLSRPIVKWFVPPVVAPPISIYCPNRTFVERQESIVDAPLESLALYGLPPSLQESVESSAEYEHLLPGLSPTGLVHSSSKAQLPLSVMQLPEAKSLIYDSAKLAKLDELLQELKPAGHRVLIYFQMTRMMDLMEEYLVYRQYKYLRLDGSSKLEDRRDMVMDWQTRPDIFVFILSTRAGGLGINLTAADTVIFYDHDWNPSNDAQAMDRAHRLGQTRQVTVYRLITRGTIDERIVQLARVKKDVQDIVVGNKNFTDVTKPSEIVQLLLNEEQLANLDPAGKASEKAHGKRPAKVDGEVVRDLWADEGDEFFGHSNQPPAGGADQANDDAMPVPPSGRGRKRKAGATGGTRGRRGGGKGAASQRKSAAANGDANPP
ncbi:hypothetical protein EWM64_g245 [Hericium alpestre]|uniref:Chromatin-remodeling ATPase INO80 n=1 Tax=Hericium alpestre TaxID=135208 RepID=A0A4Z0AAK3_9AGAM|nr:hypothetical protein EWM64_g245 [Hericium alpestre]